MQVTVETLCNQLARAGILPAETIRGLYQGWHREAGAIGGDPAQFARWLTANRHLTDYQATVLLGRRDDPLILGTYRILDRVSRGRMVGVYKGILANGQEVAIKVLPPARAADPLVLARFQREARLAMRLQHPNVLRTFQAGEQNGLHYLVMEYLEGETLKDMLRQRSRLPAAEAARLVFQALQGLQHIHEQGLVHRDLEPANLMLVSGGGPSDGTTLNLTLKILDIGLGRALFDDGAPGAGPIHITAESDQLGMPEYRSPEQARDPRKVDIRSDIYSLGCIFYQLLQGDPPFMDKNPVRLLMRHATEPPSPLAQFNLDVPAGLQQVLDSMLAKDPALRYPTPAGAAQELRPFLKG